MRSVGFYEFVKLVHGERFQFSAAQRGLYERYVDRVFSRPSELWRIVVGVPSRKVFVDEPCPRSRHARGKLHCKRCNSTGRILRGSRF